MSRKKEKITYIDDGRTIADMSGIRGGPRLQNRDPYRPRPKAKEVWKTYWSAVKMMLLPTLAVAGLLAAVYGIMALIFWFA